MAFIQYARSVIWDTTLEDVGYGEDGLVINAIKKTAGAPTLTPGKFIVGAVVQNKADGVNYINTGTTSLPVFVSSPAFEFATPTVAVLNNRFTAWGDSLTYTIGNVEDYPEYLRDISGMSPVNKGVGGNTSQQVAVRMGLIPTTATVVGGSIPTSGGVTVTFVSGFEPITLEAFNGTVFGTISGVYGSLTMVDNTGVRTFTRSASGTAVSVASAPFIPDTGTLLQGPNIIWAGRNDVSSGVSPTVLKANIATMVAGVSSQYIVLGVTNKSDEPIGNANYNIIVQLNLDLATIYGSKFIDIRSYLVSMYNPSLAQDVIDHGNDVIPNSLRADTTHLNAAGRALVASRIYSSIALLQPSSPQAVATKSSSELLASPTPIGVTNPNDGYFKKLTQYTTAKNESLGLGAEIVTASGWTSTNWTGSFATGWTHSTGNTSGLSYPLTNAINDYYQVSWTVTNRTAGSFTVTLGGVTILDAITATGAMGFRVTSTNGPLTFTPLSTFDGTISNISVKGVSAIAAPTQIVYDSTGAISYEMRTGLGSQLNTFLGISTGHFITTGVQNTGVGYSALYSNMSGTQNVAIGYVSMLRNTHGSYNVAVGFNTLGLNTVGNFNTAIGQNSCGAQTSATLNTGVGYITLAVATTGGNNTGIGATALTTLTTGIGNTAVGSSALQFMVTANFNTAVGYQAARSITASSNTALGYLAMNNASQLLTATNSTCIGNGSYSTLSNQMVFGDANIVQNNFTGSVGIGTTYATANDASAKLQIDSTTQGIAIPRMTTTQKNAIATPLEGLEVYDVTLHKKCIRTASAWETVTSV